eukprot:7389251-Prymnesium_polylepis.1
MCSASQSGAAHPVAVDRPRRRNGRRSTPPAVNSSILTLVSAEVERDDPTRVLRCSVSPCARSISWEPGVRKVTVNTALECPSPPRTTCTGLSAGRSDEINAVAESSVASQGRVTEGKLDELNETAAPPERHDAEVSSTTDAVTLALARTVKSGSFEPPDGVRAVEKGYCRIEIAVRLVDERSEGSANDGRARGRHGDGVAEPPCVLQSYVAGHVAAACGVDG